MGEARIESLGVRYYGELASGTHPLIVNAALVGLFQAILNDTVTEVNARAVAKARGIDLTESSSTRPRSFRSLLSLKLTTSAGERHVEGTVCPATAHAWCSQRRAARSAAARARPSCS
jgi:D-3-phosphoglycerate dehydrogenase